MTTPHGYVNVDLPRERWDDFLAVDEWAFIGQFLPEERAAYPETFSWDRARGVQIADAELGTPGHAIGVHSSYAYPLTVPGGTTIPSSGLTWVGVHPAHRRKGVLRSMIRDHFDRSIARGEIVSILYAAETAIYQKFAYGMASTYTRLTLSRGVELRDVPGSAHLKVRLESLNREAHLGVIEAVQRRLVRPGSIVDPVPGALGIFVQEINDRPEGEAARIVIVDDAEGPAAFAIVKRKLDWGDHGPDGKVKVLEQATATAAAARRLWGIVTDFDLTGEIRVGGLANDDPLLWMIKDIRSAKPSLMDDLWLRLLDMPAAMRARSYFGDADVVLAVTDAMIPANAGSWRLAVSPTRAEVTATTDAPDLTLDIQELAACYLGGVSMETLVDAGSVTEHTPGSARALGLAMRSPLAPVCNFHF